MNIQDRIKVIESQQQTIFNTFGIKGRLGHHIEDQTETMWCLEHGQIEFLSDHHYSYETADQHGENDKYILFWVCNNGDNYYAIFSKGNKLGYEKFEKLCDNG